MKRLQWWFSKALRTAGWPGSVGIALCLVGVVMHLEFAGRLADEATQQKQRIQEKAKLPEGSSSQGPEAQARALEAFYGNFHSKRTLTDVLAALENIASSRDLTLTKGQYRLKRDNRLASYEMAVPISGRYANVREFVGLALARHSTLSLTQVTYQRNVDRADEVHAEVRFVYYFMEK